MSDWTKSEWDAILGSHGEPLSESQTSQSNAAHLELAELFTEQTACATCGTACGSSLDWGKTSTGAAKSNVTKDYRPSSFATVWPIADQSSCGSCWAFAAAAIMEIQNWRTNSWQGMVKFSEQMILDCTPGSYGYSCAGGSTVGVIWNWMIPNLVQNIRASNYPYTNV